MSIITRLRATAVTALISGLIFLTVPTAATAAPASRDGVSSAAHFLATSLASGGDHFSFPGGTTPDVGNTIDAILALDGAGAGQEQAAKSTAWVQSQAAGYAAFDGKTFAGGALGKLAVLAAAQGVDPASFGGLDLGTQLHTLLTGTGRFGTAANDFDVTINQAMAVIGLGRISGSVPPSAVAYLAAQQCPDGGVRGKLDDQTCVPDPDATAFAAQAFLIAGDDGAATKAVAYLHSHQATDGSLPNASGEGANTNTAGVAAQSFTAAKSPGADTAKAFIASLQWGCDAPVDSRGGIAFTAADAAVTPQNHDKAIRATPQALLALAGGSLLTVRAGSDMLPETVAMTCPASDASPTATAAATAPSPAPSTAPASGEGSGPMVLVLIALLILALAVGSVVIVRSRGSRP